MTYEPLFASDPVTTDPATVDPEYPATSTVTHFLSGGSVVHANVYIAQGGNPKSTVILSPHAYGGDNMESLLPPLRNAGMNVLTFHPRGMWDNRHEYSLLSAMDDVHAAVEFLRTADEAGKRTAEGASYRVNPEMIGVMGQSGGGGTVSFASAAENDSIKFAMAFGPANHELHRDLSILDPANKAGFDFVKAETAGRVDVEKRARGMSPEDIDRLSIIHQAPNLVDKKLLLVGALHNRSSPIDTCHIPIAKALRAADVRFAEVVLDTDHSFLSKRIALARNVIAWLRSESIL